MDGKLIDVKEILAKRNIKDADRHFNEAVSHINKTRKLLECIESYDELPSDAKENYKLHAGQVLLANIVFDPLVGKILSSMAKEKGEPLDQYEIGNLIKELLDLNNFKD